MEFMGIERRVRLILSLARVSTDFSAKLPADLLAAECDHRQHWPRNWRRERDCSRLGTAAHPSLRSGPHFVRPDLLCKSVEPNLIHVRGFESLVGQRENSAK